MTVIAANRQMLSGDSQLSQGDLSYKCKKVHEVNGDFIGTAGDYSSGLAFVKWYAVQEDKPDLGDHFEALVLTKDKRILYYDAALIPIETPSKFLAIGSGSHFCVGAMAAGKTPEEAVKLTCKHMDGVSPPVVTMRRDNASPQSKRR